MNRKRVLTPLMREYPSNLRSLVKPPASLNVVGEFLPEDDMAVAVVGSRDMTEEGRKIAEIFVKDFAKSGITVVSGGARGIDTVAHKTALENGGRTVVVLGSGLGQIYPPENKKLFEEVASGSGAIFSEFENMEKPWGKNFLARNRIISGLSRAVLVVEGERKSGTLSTAAYAANQGREVFVVPGSPATDWLIEQGARVAKTPNNIIDYLNGLNNS